MQNPHHQAPCFSNMDIYVCVCALTTTTFFVFKRTSFIHSKGYWLQIPCSSSGWLIVSCSRLLLFYLSTFDERYFCSLSKICFSMQECVQDCKTWFLCLEEEMYSGPNITSLRGCTSGTTTMHAATKTSTLEWVRREPIIFHLIFYLLCSKFSKVIFWQKGGCVSIHFLKYRS